MLHFIRKKGESFFITAKDGSTVEATISEIDRNRVKISFSQFAGLDIYRSEVHHRMQKEKLGRRFTSI